MSVLLLILTSPLHVFMDGTSPVRLFLFLAYFVVLAIVLRLCPKKLSRMWQKVLQAVALVSVSLVFLSGLLLHVWVTAVHDIPQQSLSVFLADDEMTSSRLMHNHAGKAAVTVLTAPLAPYLVPVMDTGSALAHSFDSALSVCLAVLFLVALIASLVAAPAVIARGEQRHHWYVSFALYGLVAFIALEKSVDGGIFSDGALIALVAYGALLLLPPRLFMRTLFVGACAYVVIMTLLTAYGFAWGEGYALTNFGNAAVLFLVCMALGIARQGEASHRVVITFVFLALISLGAKAYFDTAGKIAYLTAPVVEDRSFVGAYPTESVPALTPIGSIGRLAIFAPDPEVGKSVAELIDTYQLPYWYQPISQYAGSCSTPADTLRATFFVLAPEPVTEQEYGVSGLALLLLEPTGTTAAGWTQYTGTLIMHPCVPRRWDVLREMLRSANAPEAIVFGFSIRLESVPFPGISGDK